MKATMVLNTKTRALVILLLLRISVSDGMAPRGGVGGGGGGGSTVKRYYNGTRPIANSGYSTVAKGFYGITIDDLQDLSDVKFCINTYSGRGGGKRSQSCFRSCGSAGDGSLKQCYCDEKCYFYNDCCPDYEILCVDGWQPTQTSQATTTDVGQTTTGENNATTARPPWYIRGYEAHYDAMDMLRNNIPDVIGNRPINEDNKETCHTPSLTPDLSYYMIATCPDDSTTDEHQLCTNDTWGSPASLVPVYVNTSGLYYANKFCADCRGYSDETALEFVSLSFEWSCGKSESPYSEDTSKQNTSAYQESSCYTPKWKFDPLPRRCNPKVVTNCPVTYDAISTACNSYSANAYSGGKNHPTIYKNVHCAYCNNVTVTWNECVSPASSVYGVVGDERGGQGGAGSVPLTILFDFTGGTLQQGQSYGGPPPPLECPEYFTYNRELHDCRRVGCPRGAVMRMGKCTYARDPSAIVNRTLSSTIDPTYRRVVIELASQSKNITDARVLDLFDPIWGSYRRVDYYEIRMYNRSHNSNEEIHVAWNGDDWMKSKNPDPEPDCVMNYTTTIMVTLEGTTYLKAIEQYVERIERWLLYKTSCAPKFEIDMLLVRASITNFPYIGRLCNESSRVPKAYGERSFSRILSDSYDYEIRMQFSGNKTETFVSNKVPQEVILSGGRQYYNEYNVKMGNWSRLDKVYFCEGIPSCPLVTLRSEDYRWQFDSDDNASLLLLRSKRIVPDNEIVLTVDGLVQICLYIDDNFNDGILYSYSSGQSLATTIGCVVSLTLLVLVITTYCSFASLRNVPGKTVLSLSLSLFLAQLLLLTGAGQTSNSAVCLIIACFMHFFWVSVFTWTNILAFDLSRTFGKKSRMRGDETGGSTFKKYSLYGWGTPLIVVGITLVVHFCQEVEGMMRNIYGITTSCWLRTGYPLLIAFGVPVAIALMANIVFFTRTVQGIRSTMQMAKILKKDHEDDNDLEFLKKELYLYVRLSVTVGLTWITGFIIPYTGVAELGYLFIILNSLQGPVIFISFTCSRRVMKLWSGKLGSSLYSTNSTGSSSVHDKTMRTQIARGGTNYNNNV